MRIASKDWEIFPSFPRTVGNFSPTDNKTIHLGSNDNEIEKKEQGKKKYAF